MLKLQHVLPFVLLTGCAVRQHGPATWRFADRTLIPPGVASADLGERKLPPLAGARGTCPESDAVTLERRRGRIIVTVHREPLLRQPRGWLTEWTERAEAANCIPAGQGPALAARILESLPLPTGAALRLTRGGGGYNYVDITGANRLQVISPLIAPGGGTDALAADAPMTVSGSGSSIQVVLKANPALIGVEMAWYDVAPKPDGRGFRILPASVEVTVNGTREPRDAPVKTYFQFGPEAGFYRLFYKADQSEVLAFAPTHTALPTDPDTCAAQCFNIPRGVGVNPYMKIEVNGAPVTVTIGATLSAVIQAAKQRPEAVLPALKITKPFAGRAAAIEFDRSKQDVLNLVLSGDEQIRW